jgi:hypothetical protein
LVVAKKVVILHSQNKKIRLGKMITESSIPEEGKEIFDMMTHTRENERSY